MPICFGAKFEFKFEFQKSIPFVRAAKMSIYLVLREN